MKALIISLFSLTFLLSVSCSDIPQTTKIPIFLSNSCLPNAHAMSNGLKEHGIESKILIVESSDKQFGHAIVIYQQTKRIWAWDNSVGTVQLSYTAFGEEKKIGQGDAKQLGQIWWNSWGQKYPEIKRKEFGDAWFLESPDIFGARL